MADELEFEKLKWIREQETRVAERVHDASREFITEVNKAAVTTGQLALRTAVLINGGAAAALLAFIGSLVGQGKVTVAQLTDVAGSLTSFALGVVSATVAMGFGYLANLGMSYAASSEQPTWQHPYFKRTKATGNWKAITKGMMVGAILFGLLSLTYFVWGMAEVRMAITKLSMVYK